MTGECPLRWTLPSVVPLRSQLVEDAMSGIVHVSCASRRLSCTDNDESDRPTVSEEKKKNGPPEKQTRTHHPFDNDTAACWLFLLGRKARLRAAAMTRLDSISKN